MDHFVSIQSLPADFRTIPPDLANRFRYDETRQQLHFLGFMSKGDFDRLTQLSDSWPYKRAVEILFQLCTLNENPQKPTTRLRRLLASFGLL